MTLAEEFRSRNFSIYGQWTGVICIILCLAVGIANIFSFNAGRIVFSCICIASGLVLVFVEVPFLLRICPTSEKFDAFIRRFTTNYMRAAVYIIMSAVQWVSIVTGASSLIAAAVFLLIASLFYALAGVKSQDFVGSKTLGGQGIAQMIV
ncbi:Golgi apparatus membrane protein tvp18 [Aspergillus nanangensis]|uniref:Golgi apparatus membrane protein tvp18 n=1 Tax=Aspergillus nanangensis TaxID=2582783 RepID=A0AAD4CNU1_ASPNN|nr:Golgi apparatus membrane protein tvp18 [Aspergillus nanangensis]